MTTVEPMPIHIYLAPLRSRYSTIVSSRPATAPAKRVHQERHQRPFVEPPITLQSPRTQQEQPQGSIHRYGSSETAVDGAKTSLVGLRQALANRLEQGSARRKGRC